MVSSPKVSLLKLTNIPCCPGQTLFSYLTRLIEEPAARILLGTLDNHQALDFKKRWIAYELDQGNANAHLPLIEFFLGQGIKMLPPYKGEFGLDDRLESIDGEAASNALSKADISGSWVVNQSIFDGQLTVSCEWSSLKLPFRTQ